MICSPTVSDDKLYFAYATSKTSTTFFWFQSDLPSVFGAGLKYRVAANFRSSLFSFGRYIDLFALERNELGGEVIYHRTVSKTGITLLEQLPLQEWEEPGASGAITAAPTSSSHSRAIFVDSNRGYLMERTSVSGDSTGQMQNYGNGNRQTFPYEYYDPTPYHDHAEGMIAERGKYMSIVMINRPGTGDNDWPSIHVVRSEDDGQTFGDEDILSKVVNGETYDYVVDPTVAVTRTGETYVLQFGQNYEGCNTPTENDAIIWLSHASFGSSVWNNIVVRFQSQIGGGSLDHPAMMLERAEPFVGTGRDRLHMAWWNQALDTVEYAYYDVGYGLSSVRPLTAEFDYGPPRITVNSVGEALNNNSDVVVYYNQYSSQSHKVHFCRLNLTRDGCKGGKQVVPYTLGALGGIDFDGTASDYVIQTLVPYSMAVPPTQNGILHACLQINETNGDGSDPDVDEETDIACARGVADANGVYGWSSLVFPGPQNDDESQLLPDVSVTEPTYARTSVASEGVIYVSWYDLEGGAAPDSYRARMAYSTDAGGTFTTPVTVSSYNSDPYSLPHRCQDMRDDSLFLGDYSIVQAAPLHTHGFYVQAHSGAIHTHVGQTFQSLGSWSGAPGP